MEDHNKAEWDKLLEMLSDDNAKNHYGVFQGI